VTKADLQGKVSIDDTGWLEPTYAAGISGFVRIRRKEGVVTIFGYVDGANISNGSLLFILPAGFNAPQTYFRFPAQLQQGGMCQMEISNLQYGVRTGYIAGQAIYINLSFLAS